MNRFKTYGLVGLCGFGVLATLDNALGLGGSALIADICRTFLEDDPAGMGDMPMDVKPVPLIAISLSATFASIFALTRDHQRAANGRAAPDEEEQAAILSAMLLVAVSQGRTTREEIADIFRIVTQHDVADDLISVVYDRYREMVESGAAQHRMAVVSTSIGRRRTLAAALIMGCVARPATVQTTELIEDIALDIGASSEDVAAARASLKTWQDGFASVPGVSPVTVLRHRRLKLLPA